MFLPLKDHKKNIFFVKSNLWTILIWFSRLMVNSCISLALLSALFCFYVILPVWVNN